MRNELLLIAVIAGCGSAAAPAPAPVTNAAPETIVVGAVLPQSGFMAEFGASVEAGLRLAVSGEGAPVELVVVDSGSTPAGAADAARALIDERHPVAVIGEVTSANTRAVFDAIAASGVPLIAPTSTSAELDELGPQLFPIAAPDPTQGEVAARWAHAQGLRRAAILNDSTAYATAIADAFVVAFERLGGAVVARERFETGDGLFLTQLAAIEPTAPDVLFVPGYYLDIPPIAQQARDRGLTAQLLGSDGWASVELLAADAVEGARYVEHFAPDDPADATRGLVSAWAATHDAPPDSLAALGYDAIVVLRDAVARAGGTEPDALLPSLGATNLRLATGALTYDGNGRPVRDMVVVRVEPERVVFEARVSAD